MAFVLKQSSSYTWPVTVEFPIDGGRYEKHTFDAEFKRMKQGEIESIMADAVKGDLKDGDVANMILVGWSNIMENGEQIPFSEKAKDSLLDVPLVASSIVKAWMDSIAGAKRKN